MLKLSTTGTFDIEVHVHIFHNLYICICTLRIETEAEVSRLFANKKSMEKCTQSMGGFF